MRKSYARRPRPTRGNPPRKTGLRVMVVVLVLIAVLIILLRLAEFSSRGGHHPRRGMTPALLAPQPGAAIFILLSSDFHGASPISESSHVAKAPVTALLFR